VESPSGKQFLKLPKLDNYNYIFTNSFHGYESGVLLYKKNMEGVVEDGIVIDMSIWNNLEFYTYLNGVKVGVFFEEGGGDIIVSDAGSRNSVCSAGLRTRKDNTSSGSEGDSKDSAVYSYYFSYDGQGNVVQVSNKAGQLPYSLYAYDSYGVEIGGEGDPTLSSYKGYDKGPFGYKTGVRQYDPETGRFLSPDPFKGYMTDPASQHPYMYCRGNPIRYSDPSGYVAVADDLIILGAAVIGAVALKAYQDTPAGKEGTRAIARGIGSLWKATTTGAKVVGHNWSLGIEQIRVDIGRVRPLLRKRSRKSGKEKASDIPSWVPKDIKVEPGKSGKDIAKELCDRKYGPGNYPKGSRTEYQKIQKYYDRKVIIIIKKDEL